MAAALIAACGIGAAQACEDGMRMDYCGQSCYEGGNDYKRAQPAHLVSGCSGWHDETPGALANG